MPNLLLRYATPFITGLFLVSLISGIALFFHLGGNGFRGMHEWLSLVVILPFVLHVWRNWRPMLAYLSKSPMAIALTASLAMALAFVIPTNATTSRRDGPPQFALAHTILSHSAGQVAPLLGLMPDALVANLTKAGFTITSPDQILTDIATASARSEEELAAILNQPGN